METLAIALNERGAKTAVKLGLPVEIGKPGFILDQHWTTGEALVLVMALPIVVRLLSKRNLSKDADPIVIAVDESGTFIIPVLGGHRGANRFASELASRGNGTAVITTSSEIAGIAAIDGLSGFVAQGNVATLIETMLDGNDPIVEYEIEWPGPVHLTAGKGPAKVIISDSATALENQEEPTVQLIPPSLVVGVGCSSTATADDVSELIKSAFEENRLDLRAIAKLATIELRADHPAITGQNIPVESFSAEELSQIDVPNSSDAVRAYVGTASVAEAAAMAASASPDLIVTKVKNKVATVAIARRHAKGHLKLVGLGPGESMMRTPEAGEAVISSEVVVGYGPYIEQCRELLSPHQLVVRSPIGEERERAQIAVGHATQGRSVSVVCSGDPEIFAMASISFEVLEAYCQEKGDSDLQTLLDISVIPGITAGLGGGALLGAPLGHDHAYLSLSDLMTPWETIERRIQAFGEADIVIVIYNPQSRTRTWQLPKTMEILARYRPPATPVAIVKNVGRHGESKQLCTMDTFDPATVDMSSLVIVGSSATRRFGDYIFTPRGYAI